MKIDFTKQYISIGPLVINTYPVKDFLVDLLKPKFKCNAHGTILESIKTFHGQATINTIGQRFLESYYDFSHVGRYNSVFYITKP